LALDLKLTIKVVEVAFLMFELTGSHPRTSKVFEVPTEPFLLVSGCHTIRIWVNSSVPNVTFRQTKVVTEQEGGIFS
jgi:hypothetical protein